MCVCVCVCACVCAHARICVCARACVGLRTQLVSSSAAGVNPFYDYAFGLAETIDKLRSTHLAGLYVHCGHSYHCKSPEEIRTVVKEVARDTAQFAAQYV